MQSGRLPLINMAGLDRIAGSAQTERGNLSPPPWIARTQTPRSGYCPGGNAIILNRLNWQASLPRIVIAATVGLFTLSFNGCHSKPSLTPQQTEGKDLYDVRCAHCHEYNDLQLRKVPPDLHGLFDRPRLPSGAPATDRQVAITVLHGKGMMPPFAGRFTQEQMEALLAYLHTNLKGESQ